MFSTYPKLSSPVPSSWFAWTGDRVLSGNAEICHAKIVHYNPGLDELITAVPNNTEVGLEYLRMLIRGPFRSMSDLIKLDRIKDNYYLHCLSLGKWPANVLMNFCIASRVPIEFKYLLTSWAKRCEAGFDPTLAFLLTYSYGGDSNGVQSNIRNFTIHRSGHIWLDPASSWSNILHGVIENQSRMYKTHPNDCRPTNCIWGHCSDYKQLVKMDDDEIAAFYTQPVQVFEKPKIPEPVVKPKWNANPAAALFGGAPGQVNNFQLGAMPIQFEQIEPQQPLQQLEPADEPDVDDFEGDLDAFDGEG